MAHKHSIEHSVIDHLNPYLAEISELTNSPQLIDHMGKLKAQAQDRVALRLNLRSRLRRLLTKVTVFASGVVALFFQTEQRCLLYTQEGIPFPWDACPKKYFPDGRPSRVHKRQKS